MPRMAALHAYQLEALDAKDEFMKDDVVLFYTTDGATTIGRVTIFIKG